MDSQRYRLEAEQIRQGAEGIADPNYRRAKLDIAAQYDRLADMLDEVNRIPTR